MLTIETILFDKNKTIRTWIENALNNGTSFLARKTVDAFRNTYRISEGELNRQLRKIGLRPIVNDDHYILSRSKMRRLI